MSDVILKWLNKEVKIPRKVRHIESDFANGVLFAEVFRKLKPEIDISAYSDKNIVANYKLLQPLLDEYRIEYDNELLRNIIMEERGAALKLLFQLRQTLEKTKPKVGKQGTLAQKTKDINETIGTGAIGRLQHYGQKLVADQAGATMREIVEKKGTDRKLLQRLAPYSEEQIRQMTKALNDQRKEERAHTSYLQQQRQSHLNIMKRNQALMAEWEAKNIENWKQSMRDKKEMLARIKFFRELEVEKHKTNIRKIMKDAAEEMSGGIDAFEKNLARQGIDINARRDGEGPQGPPPPVDFSTLNRVNIRHMQPTQMLGHFSAVATMNKIREKKNVNDVARKERDKLRTKLQLEQDRAKATLEANKKEEALVEKYIASISGEKLDNFDSWRKGYNKTVEEKNRADVANQREKELHKAIADIQAAQKEHFKEEEKRRKVEYSHQKMEYRALNMERKAEKRAAHTTTCKEITRSILDIALAVFDSREEQLEAAKQELGENFIYDAPPIMTPNWKQQKIKMSEAGKIDVKKWREWVTQFVEGKGVFDDDDDDLTPPPVLPQRDESHSQEAMGLSKDVSGLEGLVAANAVDEVEFVDYMRGLGLWEEKGLLFSEKDEKLEWKEFTALQSTFGDIIQEIIANQFAEERKEKEKLEEEATQELPSSELTLKMCINGPIFTGKSAHAQSLKQKYPELLVLQAEQVLKEALILSDPVRKEEQANIDPKKKKEPPKKGQQEDIYTLLTQEYQGTEFQRLSGRVREDLLKERENAKLSKSGRFLGMSVDTSQSVDEKDQPLRLNEAWTLISPQNMAKLLVCRIKQNAEKYQKSEEEKEAEMRKQIIREKEIVQELAKLAEEAAALANDPKAKKPAPGKPGQKTPEELLKEELEEIKTPPLNGWIIVGYPNTQEQATVLFEKLSGFKQTAQQGERPYQLYSHSAASLAPASDILQGNRKQLNFPGCDVMISLLGSTSESIRRYEGRKVDPATGTIYHMDDNPPPPNLAVDKLQDVQEEEGALPHSPEAISNSFEKWEAEFRYFQKWMRQFGIEGYLRTHFVENGGQGPSTKIDIPRARVLAIAQQLVKVKADMLEKEKEKLRNKMAQEPDETPEEESPAQVQESKEVEKQSVEPPDASQNVTPLPQDDKVSDRRSVSKPSYSRLTGRPRTRAQSKAYLFACWNELAQLYISTVRSQLLKLSNQQVTVMNGMTTLQQRFAQFLVRPDNKQALLDQFFDSFQNLAHANPGWEANPAIHAQLNQMLEKTGDELWDVIERRKDEAEAERSKIIQTGWVKKQLVKTVRTYHRLANLEFMKFRVSLLILKQHLSEVSDDIDVEETELVSKLESVSLFNPDQEEQIMAGALKDYEMPKIEAINFALSHRVDSLFSSLVNIPLNQSMEFKNIESYQTIANNLRRAVKYRGAVLRAWFVRETIEIMQMSASIYQRMDDWIVTSVFGENKMIGAAVKSIQRAINQGQTEVPSQIAVGPVRIDAFEITPLDAAGLSSRRSSGLLPKLGSQVGAFLLGGFSTQQLRMLIEALQKAAEDNLYISRRKAFKFFLSLSKEEPDENGITALPDAWRGFSSMMFRVLIRSLDPQNKGYFEWRHLATYFCLLKSSLPLAMELNYYRNSLRQNSIQIKPAPAENETDQEAPSGGESSVQVSGVQVGRQEMYINLQKFLETGAWFDENEKDEKDQNRLAEIKWMLFEINKEASVEYEEDRLHIDQFLKVVCGTDYLRDEKSGDDDSLRQRSYYELLFDMK